MIASPRIFIDNQRLLCTMNAIGKNAKKKNPKSPKLADCTVNLQGALRNVPRSYPGAFVNILVSCKTDSAELQLEPPNKE